METVKEIIINYLKNNNYDGLMDDGICGCEISDLVPCGGDFSKCNPGYKVVPPEWITADYPFYICSDKAMKPWVGESQYVDYNDD